MTNNQKVTDLINAANELIDFIEKENISLLKSDAGITEAHNTQKDMLTRSYEGYVNSFQEYTLDTTSLDKSVRDEVSGLADKLKEIVSKNVVRLRSRYEANMMLLESYAKAVNEVSSKGLAYANNGEIIDKASPSKNRPSSSAINQSL